MHYLRWRRYGRLDLLPDLTEADRFFSYVVFGEKFEGTHCLLWTGATDDDGYGRFGTRPTHSAHRWLYERWVGPIPEGHHLHHRCPHKNCVNPMHTEPITPADHVREHAALKTACVNGHDYTPENTYRDPRDGSRACRRCRTDAGVRYRIKKEQTVGQA